MAFCQKTSKQMNYGEKMCMNKRSSYLRSPLFKHISCAPLFHLLFDIFFYIRLIFIRIKIEVTHPSVKPLGVFTIKTKVNVTRN